MEKMKEKLDLVLYIVQLILSLVTFLVAIIAFFRGDAEWWKFFAFLTIVLKQQTHEYEINN